MAYLANFWEHIGRRGRDRPYHQLYIPYKVCFSDVDAGGTGVVRDGVLDHP